MKSSIIALAFLSLSAFASQDVIKHSTCEVETLYASYDDQKVIDTLIQKGYILKYSEINHGTILDTTVGSLHVVVGAELSGKAHLPGYQTIQQGSGLLDHIENKLIKLNAKREAKRRGHVGAVEISTSKIFPAGYYQGIPQIQHVDKVKLFSKDFRKDYIVDLPKGIADKYFQEILDLIPECQIQ